MYRYVVAYDISDDKRRRRVGEALEAYGVRVNYSVFEIEIKSQSQKRILEEKILKIIEPRDDSFRIYHICQNCAEKSWSLGDEKAPFQRDSVLYF